MFIDPKQDDYRHYLGATRKVLRAAQAEGILATRSEKGMMLIEASGAVHTESVRAREVFDVSGAGDTVVAVLALAHASGQPLPQAMRLANTAAGIVVGKLATAAVELDELILELSREAREDHIGQAKIYGAAVACPLKPGPGLMLGLAVTGNRERIEEADRHDRRRPRTCLSSGLDRKRVPGFDRGERTVSAYG